MHHACTRLQTPPADAPKHNPHFPTHDNLTASALASGALLAGSEETQGLVLVSEYDKVIMKNHEGGKGLTFFA